MTLHLPSGWVGFIATSTIPPTINKNDSLHIQEQYDYIYVSSSISDIYYSWLPVWLGE